MTGGGGGSHRGRVTGEPGGAHWWGGTGPTGGGSHAARPGRRRVPVLLIALLVVFLAGVAVIAVAVTRGPDPAPASATAPTTGPADASPAVHPDARTATPADAAVLQNTIDEVVTDHPLRFPADATTPAPGTADTIDRLAAVLRATPGPPVVLEGHTAPAGESTGAAATLSRQRAEEVARRLEAAGVPTGRLTTVGVGPDRPLASLEASRRVEVRVGS